MIEKELPEIPVWYKILTRGISMVPENSPEVPLWYKKTSLRYQYGTSMLTYSPEV